MLDRSFDLASAGDAESPGGVRGGRGGLPASAPEGVDTPLTNRGCFSAETCISESETGIGFHLDYLRITVFSPLESVVDLVSEGLHARAGVDPGWVDRGAGSRWGKIMQAAGPVDVLEPRPTTSGRAYCCVEMKGEGCTFFGDDLLQGFLSYVESIGYPWHGKRVDPCWDGVTFDPATVYDAIARGDLNSRCFDIDGREIWQNDQGRTTYLKKTKGEKDRMLRLYDRRGWNRFEFQMGDRYADLLLRELIPAPVSSWSDRAKLHVRAAVDFVDHTASAQPSRCPLLPWWAAFVGSTSKVKLPGESRKDPRKLTPLGRAQMLLQRCAKSLLPIKRAFGENYLIDQLERFGGGEKYGPDQQRFEQELLPFVASGMCGLDGDFSEAPF